MRQFLRATISAYHHALERAGTPSCSSLRPKPESSRKTVPHPKKLADKAGIIVILSEAKVLFSMWQKGRQILRCAQNDRPDGPSTDRKNGSAWSLPIRPTSSGRCLAILVTSIFAFTQTPLFAQEFAVIRGQILDSLLAQPVAGVSVTAMPSGVWTTTDAQGKFQFIRVPPGATTLQIESAFHISRNFGPIFLREGEGRELVLYIQPIAIRAAEVNVVAERSSSLAAISYSRKQLEKSPSRNVGEFLGQSGLHLQSDGRAQYASLRGFAPSSVLVLIDGAPVNPDGTAFDLSTISLETVERIEVYHGSAAATFGPNALGGAINIVSRKAILIDDAGLSFSIGGGSYDSRAAGAAGHLRTAKFSLNGNFDYDDQKNDFEYEHPYLGAQTRHNNYRLQRSGYVRLQSDLLAGLSASGRFSDGRSGVPGAIFQESQSACAAREMRLLTLGYQRSALRADLNYRELSQSFRDQQAFVPYDVDYHQIARSATLAWEPKPQAVTPTFGIEYLRERFSNDDHQSSSRSLPKVTRETFSASSALRSETRLLSFRLTSDLRLRADHGDHKTNWSPFVATGAQWSSFVLLGLEASYGESYRRPPIDALFWREDVFSIGNPDLKSESAINRDLTCRIEWSRYLPVRLSHAWFESEVANLIAWRRQFDGKYKPINIDQARQSGRELKLEIKSPSDRITLRYSRQELSAVNESAAGGYYGQTIPFRPNRVENLSLDFNAGSLRVSYRYSFTGERFIREANTKAQPGYALHDITFELRRTVGALEHQLRLSIRNITDHRYELLERMPMPPRSFGVDYTVEW